MILENSPQAPFQDLTWKSDRNRSFKGRSTAFSWFHCRVTQAGVPNAGFCVIMATVV